jgi:hypothetical protein
MLSHDVSESRRCESRPIVKSEFRQILPSRLQLLVQPKLPVSCAGSNGRCNTIWYKAVFKSGVYEAREAVWAFSGAEVRRVASLESRADAA